MKKTTTAERWAQLKRRWKLWHRPAASWEPDAKRALMRCGAFKDEATQVRCIADHETGRLVILVYLSDIDEVVWVLGRHIEYYVMRHMRALHGVAVHSVHLSVTRERAFRDIPRIEDAKGLRIALRGLRRAWLGVPGGTNGAAKDSGPASLLDDSAYDAAQGGDTMPPGFVVSDLGDMDSTPFPSQPAPLDAPRR